MAYVIVEKCLGERYATCVEVCPVDCIHPGDYQDQEFMVFTVSLPKQVQADETGN